MKKILRAFKLRKLKKRKFYICDPDKNHKCSKEACWLISGGPCKCTSKKKYAKISSATGEPDIAKDEDLYNLDYLEHEASKRAEFQNRTKNKAYNRGEDRMS